MQINIKIPSFDSNAIAQTNSRVMQALSDKTSISRKIHTGMDSADFKYSRSSIDAIKAADIDDAESENLTAKARIQILQDGSSAMLAQANLTHDMVLNLIR